MSWEKHEMNLKVPFNYSSFYKKLARFLVCEIAAFSASFFLVTTIADVAISKAALEYVEENTPIGEYSPSPGGSMFIHGYVYGAAFLSLSFTLPVAVLVHMFIFNTFFVKIPSKYSALLNKLALFIIFEILAFYISVFLFLAMESGGMRWWFSLLPILLIQVFIFKKFLTRRIKKDG
jgi:hypothetical protein